MPDLYTIKESDVTDTPLVLFECTLNDGTVERWSTNEVVFGGDEYAARVLRYNAFELGATGDDTGVSHSKLSLTLSNVDSRLSQLERAAGFHGATISASFVFFDLSSGTPTSASKVLFRGVGDSAAELTEAEARLVFQNRLSFQRNYLPQGRIQSRCPWLFPKSMEHRQEATNGGDQGTYSRFFDCGYSADVVGGVGNMNGSAPYDSCDYTRASCQQRGMFSVDSRGSATSRFAGLELLPADVLREAPRFASPNWASSGRYGDYVPLNYGTSWVQPPVVFARNFNNNTVLQLLLGRGPIEGILKVIANRVELPQFEQSKDLSGTGWYRMVSRGERNGSASETFLDESGNPITPPYGGHAYVEVSLPQGLYRADSTPRIDVLLQGLRLPRFNAYGEYLDTFFTANPAWVLLDILRRAGWQTSDIDLGSFAQAADLCDETLASTDINGTPILIPRYRCNLSLVKKSSIADLLRGFRLSCGFYLVYSDIGALQLRVEDTLARQQGNKPLGSNSSASIGGGWPAYEFGDGNYGFSGIVRTKQGEPSIRIWSRSAGDTPNRLRVEFSDEFNLYQSDTLSIVDIDQSELSGTEIWGTVEAAGLSNFSHANRALGRLLRKATKGNCYIDFDTSIIGLSLRPGDIITITYAKEGLDRKQFRILRVAAELNLRTIHITAQAHEDGWYSDQDDVQNWGSPQPSYGSGIPRPLMGSAMTTGDQTNFEIVESSEEYTDGTGAVALSVAFETPRRPSTSVRRVPIVSLSPEIATTGGNLIGGRSAYYAVAGVDSAGNEGALSFVVRADLPAGTGLTVTLTGLSFPLGTATFHAYRGDSPHQLNRIASGVSIATSFLDNGMTPQAVGPTDEFYDHANFYWRLETHPPLAVTTSSTTTLTSASLSEVADALIGRRARIVSGHGSGQERTIVGNTATELTISPRWEIIPNNTSEFLIAEGSWHFGATAWASPVTIRVPNRRGAFLHIQGRSANAANAESGEQLAPQTRWLVGGAAGRGGDLGIPGAPIFGLAWRGQGTIELTGISFFELTNTNTIASGTLILHYFDEISGVRQTLNGAIDGASSNLTVLASTSASPESYIQIDGEIMQVEEVIGATGYQVLRGQLNTAAVAHANGASVYHLSRKLVIVSFPRSFFGSPASGAYSSSVYLPNARIGAAQMLVTNQNGSSPTRAISLTGSADYGLRTLSGGQFTLQVDGYLAIQSSACPPLYVEDTRSVRDVFALLKTAPVGAPVELRINKSGTPYASLTIPSGSTISNIVNGVNLPPLEAGTVVTLDIVAVGQGAETTPGGDLTAVIRL